ncbi:MAG: extracellular solute-binding protein [Candidimonas sp.]|nr:MAG: extracellular solute-binding protein [Candidimonas sp.]
MERREFFKRSAAAAVGLSGIGAPLFALAQSKTLAIMTWGGQWGNGMVKYIDTPFAKKTGFSVTQDRGASPVERVTKLKINASNQTYDLVQIHDGVVPIAEAQGVLAPLDAASPNLPLLNAIPARFKRPGWVAMIYSVLGIAYNTDQVKEAPRGFADLWRPEFKGRIVLPTITHSIGPYIIPIGAMAAGKGPNDAKAGFEMLRKMVKLDPIWARDTDTIMNALTTGEAVIGLLYRSQTYTVQDRGGKVKWVFPGEGAISYSAGTSVAKGTKHKDAAEQYVNMTLDPQHQTWVTEVFNYAGTNPATLKLLPPRLRERVHFTDEQMAHIIDLDQKVIAAHRPDWTDQWNRIVAGA